MKRLVLASLFVLFSYVRSADAVCSSHNRRELAGQIPDLVFTRGTPGQVTITPRYAAWYDALESNCGVFARVTAPGTSVTQTYGCSGSGCPVRPAPQWAAVGSADPPQFYVVDTDHNSAGDQIRTIPVSYDGSLAAPAGLAGFLEISYATSDTPDPANEGDFKLVRRVPIYLQTAPVSTWFRVATSTGTSGNSVVIDHPYLNGNPSMKLFVSHVRNPTGGGIQLGWNHPVGVSYNTALQRWTIVNLDNANMPSSLTFNVRIDPSAETICAPLGGPYQDLPIVNVESYGNPYAVVFITPIAGGNTEKPVAAYYSPPYWRIKYSNNAEIYQHSCFFVKTFGFGQYIADPSGGDPTGFSYTFTSNGVGTDVRGFGISHNTGAKRILYFNWALGANPYLPMIATANANPIGYPTFFDPRNIGVAYNTSSPAHLQSVAHQDGSAMSTSAAFNIWAPYQPAYPPY